PSGSIVYGDGTEGGIAQTNDHAGHAFITNEEVAAAAENPHRRPLGTAVGDQFAHFLHRSRLGQHLRGASQLERRVGRERHLALYNRAEIVEKSHVAPPLIEASNLAAHLTLAFEQCQRREPATAP